MDELFGADQQKQTGFSTLMSDPAEQQQHTATFAPQQLPNSWTSYLSSGTRSQQEGVQQSPVGGASAGSGSAAQQLQDEKQERIRDKNRRAMRKFRERQKVNHPQGHL